MTRISVWAPNAARVDLVSAAVSGRMAAGTGGWHAHDAPLAPGTDYAFSLDGSDPLPDPRSPWQPHGVHGDSRTVDHNAFGWTDADWRGRPLADCVVYEVHLGTFTAAGTLDSAIDRLPHLTALGVDAVEVMPVAAFPGARGWGYDGVDLFAVQQSYGGPDALRRFVDACHSAGLAVILDVVYNHLGPDGNHLAAFGPYFTDTHRTPWGDAVNYDAAGSDEVRRFVVDNALTWLRDYHCDGLRLDAVHAIVDTSATHIVEEVATAVHTLGRELGRTLWVIAESDLNDPRVVNDQARGGYACDAQWSDDFHHALHASLTGETSGYYMDFGRVGDIASALKRAFAHAGEYSTFRQRHHGRSVGDLPATRFLGYMQNHDQVGNRARGERSSALMSTGRLQIAAALVLLGPFVPMLFAGEEWAASTPFLYFTDHQDKELGRLVSEGRRREFATFGWRPEDVPDPQEEATFARSRLRWDELEREPHATVLRWHRDLIALRRATPGLRDGDRAAVEVEFDEAARWLVMRRVGITVACNWGDAPAALRVSGTTLLANCDHQVHDGVVSLAADGCLVLRDASG